jgi:CHAT domain-containing protein
MVETLAASRVGVPAGVAPEIVERARELQHQLTARLDRQLRLVTGPHSEAQAGAERAAVDALRGQLRAAQADLAAAGPRYDALRQPPVLSAVDTQRLLGAETVALEYALGEERSVLFVVGATSLEAHRLPPRAAIESAVESGLKALARPPRGADPAAARSALEELSGMLLGPASGAIEGKRLVVVPDGPLQTVPFAALPSPARQGEALIERHQVVAVPSASLVSLLRAEAAHRPSPTRSVMVFADPVFDRDDERVGSRSGSPSPLPRNLTRAIEDAGMGSRLGRLPFTRREATAIVGLAPGGTARLDFEASRQNVTSADLARYRFVHFATHGFLNSSHPDLSGLVLTLFDRKGEPRDGFLSAGDVVNLDLAADLVVLSGCRTALGREVRGEGVVGLARAFMYAGTSRVLASLWKVDDAATAELMGQLYRGLLRDRLSPAEALQKAQRAMARHKHWNHPYYWAGFQLQGDWR